MEKFAHLNRVGDTQVNLSTDGIVDRIERDINCKFRDVQSATACKVLRRFYKRIQVADQGTEMEEDLGKVERARLESIIQHLKSERDDDYYRLTVILKDKEEMSKRLSVLLIQVREMKQAKTASEEK